MPTVTRMAASAPISPGIVTIRPATPSVTPSSAAIDGSRPTGRNSVVTSAKAPTAIDSTASQAPRAGAVAAAGAGAGEEEGNGASSATTAWVLILVCIGVLGSGKNT